MAINVLMRTIKKLRRRTGGALTVLTLVGAGLLFGPEAASAQTCINEVWKAHSNNQNLTCTSGDVTLSEATNIDIITGGSCDPDTGVCSCDAGGTVTFTADFRMDLTAEARYDVGFYIATDGDPNDDGALTGQCSATASLAGNTLNFINLDAADPKQAGDVCGDITDGPPTNNPLFVQAQISAPCPLTPGEQLVLPFATTWRQPGSNDVCDGTGNGTTTNDVFPGSPSKCNVGNLVLDIIARPTTINVIKTALTTGVPETGGTASYSVEVENTSTIAVTLNSLIDDKYGDLALATNSTCVPDASAATCEIGGVIAAGGSCSCTFEGPVPPGDFGGDPFKDTVTACADNATAPDDVCDSDDAEVPYDDVSSAPTLTKTANATQCVIDQSYAVVVTNTSTTESLTLNTLTDDVYGIITTPHSADTSCSGSDTECGEVVSTTCGQASPGAGTLPVVIAALGNYTCSFVGRITSCNHTEVDTVTGGAVDEDGVPFAPSDTATVIVTVTKPAP